MDKQIENKEQEKQQDSQELQGEANKIRACDRKREENKLFEINKKFQRFLQLLSQQQNNKPFVNYLEITKNQFDKVLKGDNKVLNLLVQHHGNGDKNDFDALKKFLDQFGQNQVTVFPAFGWAFVQFQEYENVLNCLKSLEVQKYNEITKFKKEKLEQKQEEQKNYYDNDEEKQYQIYYNILNFLNFKGVEHKRHCFFLPTNKDLKYFEGKSANQIPNASRNIDIPGLIYIPDFITPEEEEKFFAEADAAEWKNLQKRKVQHYGHEFIYGKNTAGANKIEDFPPLAKEKADIIDSLIEKQGAKQKKVNQLTLNSYEPGAGIPPHVDSHGPFEEFFGVFSLGDDCVMSFRNVQDQEKNILFPRRSLVIFSGEARYAWQHSIAARKVDKVENEMHFRQRRISYTFRAIKDKAFCDCKYNYFCDFQGYDPETMNQLKNNALKPKGLNQKPGGNTVFARTEDEVKAWEQMQEKFKNEQLQKDKNQQQQKQDDQLQPSDVEKTFVYDVYDKIASHFSNTRYKPWPKVTEFLNSIEEGSLVADIGCGNGKYLSCPQNKNGEYFMIGTDRSQNLIEICREREPNCQVFSADSLKLPWRSGIFDAAISIAVIHHFSNDFLRIQALREIHRVLNKEGRALIYVWAMEQKERKFQEQDIFVPWHNQFKFEEELEKKQKTKKTQKKVDEDKKESEEQNQNNDVKQNKQEEEDEDQISQEEKKKMEAEKYQQKIGVDQKVSKVDAEKQSVVYKRYYHVFIKGELEALVEKSGLFDIEDSYFDHANWAVILRKKQN
ncbi:hypothetical protein PPERSA_10870 [Pseudocohnilembus persalinus]|uniref:Fe2OG dioxygenase domain-containing protein n=1 Tax=Pseudocohnilembus persalinus TaxID=266149 RepID=A0A0V0QDU0_PSEPJ|nr:hypothetical protein PPERSA_10870 [Pseudocohnilembus persalinus]|eukprot:KRX00371.1 hypothetical protein PPERSA_10870 [Pseudocohnilembus persalinus]